MYILKIKFESIKSFNNLNKKLLKIKKNLNLKKKQTKFNGFFKIKNKNKIFTLLKSPHVNKKSREQFIYKKFINKINIKFNNFSQLLNFIFILKKNLINNYLIKIKIICL